MKKINVFIITLVVFCCVYIYYRNFKDTIHNSNEIILADEAFLKGDVDGDGNIGSSDYILVRKHLLDQGKLTGDRYTRADANGDGDISSTDYITIRKSIISGDWKKTPAVVPTSKVTPTVTVQTTSQPTVTATEKPTATSTTKPTAAATATTKPLTYSSKLEVVETKYSYIVANYNVLDYGADPTGVKDSTEAFKRALSDASTCYGYNDKCTGGRVVYAPKGKYLITEPLTIEAYTGLIGDLKEGTTDGTILMIKHSKNSTDINKAALTVQVLGSVQNMAFWYPEQSISNGSGIPYPPTIQFGRNGTDGVTLENLYFVNSYTAMDLGSARENNSIFFIENIYGTPLNLGIYNDSNYDTIKMNNINFSSKYWVESGLSNIPSKDALKKVLINSSKSPIGIKLARIDWFFLANVNIEDYFIGIKFVSSQYGLAEGELFDSKIQNCYYPIYAEKSKHMTITSSTIKASGGGGARAIYISGDNEFDYSINSSNISSSGDYALYYEGKNSMAITNSTINGKVGKINSNSQLSFVGCSLSNTGYDTCSVDGGTTIDKKNYNKKVVTKPKSKNIEVIKANFNADITSMVKSAISKLSSTGGIVYIPSGVYTISDHINVPSGIEIIGSVQWAHHYGYDGPTVIETRYKGNALFTLQSNAGLNGFAIVYPENRSNKTPTSYPYSIKGSGTGVYVRNMIMPSSWNGIDLSSANCDNHYLEHIWGEFFNVGIKVGAGSRNGIIRFSHFNVSVLRNTNDEGYKLARTNQVVFDIGSSENETIFNTFTFGPSVGYYFHDAANFLAVGIGADESLTGIKISGKSIGQIINALVVTQPNNTYGVAPENNHYIVTTSDYNGFVKIVNPLLWGNDKGTALVLAGSGDIHFASGIVENSGIPALELSNSMLSLTGVVFYQPLNATKFIFNTGASTVYMAGNLCDDRRSCVEQVQNNAGANFGNVDTGSKCSINNY